MIKNRTKYDLDKFYTKIFKHYDLINRLFTFGMDKKWRGLTVNTCLRDNPDKVLDLCCGTGDLAIELSKRSDKSLSITGYDINESMLNLARKKSESIENKPDFKCGPASELPFRNDYFDCISIGFGFRNLTFENPNRGKHLTEIVRVLNKDGKLVILESGIPANILIRFFYKIFLYLFLIPLGGLISGDFKAYHYLATSSAKFYKIDELKLMLLESGLKEFTCRKFLFGATNLISVKKS
jgi:demethylmenaquinone methyltransferase/2-methoxy-6-polyprenyl-1,4-benzoquinol methylase